MLFLSFCCSYFWGINNSFGSKLKFLEGWYLTIISVKDIENSRFIDCWSRKGFWKTLRVESIVSLGVGV